MLTAQLQAHAAHTLQEHIDMETYKMLLSIDAEQLFRDVIINGAVSEPCINASTFLLEQLSNPKTTMAALKGKYL